MYREEDNEIHDLLKFVSISNIIMNCPLHFLFHFYLLLLMQIIKDFIVKNFCLHTCIS
jgi:hypothetical protein